MEEHFKKFLRDFYINQRKSAYQTEYFSKHKEMPSPELEEAFLSTISEEELIKDVKEGMQEIRKMASPSIFSKFAHFVLPSGLATILFLNSLAFLILQIHHKLYSFPKETINFYLYNYPFLGSSIVSLLACVFIFFKALKKAVEN